MSDPRVDPSAAGLRGVNAYWRALDADAIRNGEHRALIGGMWDDVGALQFEFLKQAGLEPRHRLLDVGCGALRGGLHFARYLDPGHYCGMDANASLIEAARAELGAAGLDPRGAHLLADADFRFDAFGGRFDYAIAVSLFTHLFLNHIQVCLVRIAGALAPDGCFYATYFEAPATAHLDPIVHAAGEVTSHYATDPFHQSFSELAALAASAGLEANRIGDFGHPRGQYMAMFRRRG